MKSQETCESYPRPEPKPHPWICSLTFLELNSYQTLRHILSPCHCTRLYLSLLWEVRVRQYNCNGATPAKSQTPHISWPTNYMRKEEPKQRTVTTYTAGSYIASIRKYEQKSNLDTVSKGNH